MRREIKLAIVSKNTTKKKSDEDLYKMVPVPKTNSDTGVVQEASNKVVNKNYQTPYGGNQEAQNTINSTFSPSNDYYDAQKKADAAYGKYEYYTLSDPLSRRTETALDDEFKVPRSVKEADAWLSEQLQVIQSGKTSYSDKVRDIIKQIQNKEEFSYDPDTDPMFQQALSSALKSGQTAMQNTIGQASALTGGYGSTYATTAGNQAYNAFIEDAYNNLPEYYQMARDAYEADMEQMYKEYSMLSSEDDKEYNRNLTAYDATYQHRNQMYNEAYTQYRDEKSDAFAMANVELQKYAQKSSNLYNMYTMADDYADTMYERQYQKWSDDVNLALTMQEMYRNDAWNKYGYDWEAEQNKIKMDWETSERIAAQEYNSAEALLDREHQINLQNDAQEHDSAENELNRQHQSSENALDRAQQDKWNQAEMDYKYAALNKSSSGGGGGGGGKSSKLKTPTESQMKKALEAYNSGGTEAYSQYLNSISDSYDKSAIEDYVAEFGQLDYSLRTYTVVDDGGWNLGWGVDNNAVVKDNYDNKFTLKELAEYDEDIAKELSKPDYTKGKTYTKPKKK